MSYRVSRFPPRPRIKYGAGSSPLPPGERARDSVSFNSFHTPFSILATDSCILSSVFLTANQVTNESRYIIEFRYYQNIIS